MNLEDELDAEAAAADRHLAALAAVAANLIGWKVESQYLAKRGSVYAKLVSTCDVQYITKLRIADHEETSGSHSAADLTLLVSSDGTADIAGVVAAIIAMEDGNTY
jgi:hypothetical protein